MSEAKKKKTLETYVRFGGFILLILLNVIMLFSYKFYTYNRDDDWKRDFGDE
jgi:hypothetical protein